MDPVLGIANGLAVDFELFALLFSSIAIYLGITTAPGIANLFGMVDCLGVVNFFAIPSYAGFRKTISGSVNNVGVNYSGVATFSCVTTCFPVVYNLVSRSLLRLPTF